ncbi:hypothetical protein MKS88_002211 [Plasmodium brasilianum]|uniref:Uncharacterized protein n=1 Tax=Plasmodium brasilianum TaxID=5824 RepID=A0ACB9YC07_PLABR|nr:hypothetical protein MKS88_002211 [Plasmodium brasilianum]
MSFLCTISSHRNSDRNNVYIHYGKVERNFYALYKLEHNNYFIKTVINTIFCFNDQKINNVLLAFDILKKNWVNINEKHKKNIICNIYIIYPIDFQYISVMC